MAAVRFIHKKVALKTKIKPERKGGKLKLSCFFFLTQSQDENVFENTEELI